MTRAAPRTVGSRFYTIILVGCALGMAACAPARKLAKEEPPAIPSFSLDSVARDATGTKVSALVGTIQDSASARPLAGVQIRLASRSTLRNYYFFSDQRGGFVAQALPSDVYDLLIRNVDYRPYATQLSLPPGIIDTLRVRLGRFVH